MTSLRMLRIGSLVGFFAMLVMLLYAEAAFGQYCFSPGSPPVGGRDVGMGVAGLGPDPFDIKNPSPTAASIGRLAVADVAIQTGAATVSIPLYEVQNRAGFTVPIALEYHSNGLKVDDISSWVGAGWTLNAGGVVTRSVVGLPDEDNGYPITKNIFKMGPGVEFVTPHLVRTAFWGLTDLQPDFFAFSGPGLSGRFVWHGIDTFRVIPHQPVEVWRTVFPGGDWVWTITKDFNITYHYDFLERTQSGPRYAHLSSWYLTEIRHPAGNIDFSYSVKNSNLRSEASAGTEYRNMYGSEACNQLNGGGSSLSVNYRDDVVLTQIDSDDVRVEFYSSLRDYAVDVSYGEGSPQELSGKPWKLDSIRVFTQNGDELIRSFIFEYWYAASYAGSRVSNRMFLESVTEVGHDGVPLPSYRFEYVSMGGFPVRLAYTAQDAWGYAGPGGLLTHVYHPTGGYEQIEYEPNVYEYGFISGYENTYSGQTHKHMLDASFDELVRGEQLVRDTFIVQAGVADSTILHYSYSVFAGEDALRQDRYVLLECPGVYDSGPLYSHGEHMVNVPNGTECIAHATVSVVDATNPDARTNLSFHWHEWGEFEETRASNVVTGGGFRVRRRNSWPADSSAPIVKEYIYTDEQGQTTGLGHKPEFEAQVIDQMCIGTIVHSHSQTTIGPEGTVQYRRVRVREGQGGVFGETDYRFYVHLNYPDVGEGVGFFSGAMTNHDWLSRPTGERYRNAAGELLREVDYGYSSLPIGPIPDMSWAIGIRTMCIVDYPGEIPHEHIFPAYYNTYNVQSGRNWLMEMTETTYDEP